MRGSPGSLSPSCAATRRPPPRSRPPCGTFEWALPICLTIERGERGSPVAASRATHLPPDAGLPVCRDLKNTAGTVNKVQGCGAHPDLCALRALRPAPARPAPITWYDRSVIYVIYVGLTLERGEVPEYTTVHATHLPAPARAPGYNIECWKNALSTHVRHVEFHHQPSSVRGSVRDA